MGELSRESGHCFKVECWQRREHWSVRITEYLELSSPSNCAESLPLMTSSQLIFSACFRSS